MARDSDRGKRKVAKVYDSANRRAQRRREGMRTEDRSQRGAGVTGPPVFAPACPPLRLRASASLRYSSWTLDLTPTPTRDQTPDEDQFVPKSTHHRPGRRMLQARRTAPLSFRQLNCALFPLSTPISQTVPRTSGWSQCVERRDDRPAPAVRPHGFSRPASSAVFRSLSSGSPSQRPDGVAGEAS